MNKVVVFFLAVILITACGIKDPITYVAWLDFDVQDQVETKYSIIRDSPGYVIWEEGDCVDFTISVLVPMEERTKGGVMVPEDFLFKSSGKLAYEAGNWNVYVLSESEYSKSEKIKVTSLRKDAEIIVDFQIPSTRWVKGYPFQEGEQTIDVALAEHFLSTQ